ncbi:DUF2730 family protein [Bradyrhizobium sp. BR 10289]|uniref:DUF2730 family protein n=1 Tax=Bradyrhizobium sp. BR 10289 TaxID=2749993 RepID=UPI001C64DE24|nr:DUF2730 family protein [Bradyrhizobium sp. BR 10289]MBW7968161.1 DUF2730 family protein [Bradyrhizobium sp. BR 10289]
MNDWAPWVAIAIAAASFLYPIFNGRSKKIDARLASIEETQKHDREQALLRTVAVQAETAAVRDRVTKLETEVEHLPDKDVTHRLEMLLAGVQTEVRGLSERVKPIAAMADRIQEAMVDKVMG